jgi:hypothetical protein
MQFAMLLRRITVPVSRRETARALAGIGLTVGLTRAGQLPTSARKKQKRKPKFKPQRNAFGCADVGSLCAKNDQCCSGACAGSKREKRCQAHDVGSRAGGGLCEPGDTNFCTSFAGSLCNSTADEPGTCLTTTGKAGFCAFTNPLYACVKCGKDADCQQFCGPQAAYIDCPACAGQGIDNTGTACVGIDNSCIF